MPLGDLLQILADRARFKTPLEIEIDENGCIRARHFTFDGNYSFGSTIHHEGQTIDRGVRWPTEQDYYPIEVPDKDVPYEGLKSIVRDAKHDDPDDLPWIKYDNMANRFRKAKPKKRCLRGCNDLSRTSAWRPGVILAYPNTALASRFTTRCRTRSAAELGWC